MIALLSDAVQTAIYGRLSADAALAGIVGAHVYDAMPAGLVPDIYVLIGEESVFDASDKSAHGALHEITIAVISAAESFLTLKQAASAVADALDSPALTLPRGEVIALWFLGSTAKRNTSGERRVDLKFRVRVEA